MIVDPKQQKLGLFISNSHNIKDEQFLVTTVEQFLVSISLLNLHKTPMRLGLVSVLL